jgi:protocatechuate 3,4-dioxygenase beta subunit
MNFMQKKLVIMMLITSVGLHGCTQSSNQQSNRQEKVGGGCEGCEAIYESPVSFKQLPSVDTLPDFNDPGPRIMISGIVYQRDGKTPAKNVVVYVYHTDQTGHYTPEPNAQGWGKRHGRIRGWMRTDGNGFYKFYTLRPAHYPDGNAMAHIHVTIKEPDKNEYWISEYLFDDDPLLTAEKRKMEEARGGSGIIKLIPAANGTAQGTRNIILGLNVPNYSVD